MNAMFQLELIDSSGLFSVDPKSAVGSTNVGIRLARGPLDFENPNQQKFILLVSKSPCYVENSSHFVLFLIFRS